MRNKLHLMTTLFWVLVILSILPAATAQSTRPATVEQWDIFETSLKATADGNPFDVRLSAEFTSGEKRIKANGFYDGDGVYRIRFMPPAQGVWQYQTKGDLPEFNDQRGEFTATKPGPNNHGPVGVRNTYHFGYADGTRYIPIGTTAYGWAHQQPELQEQTLVTLKSAPFTKMRMCIFPTRQREKEPVMMPYEMIGDGAAAKSDHMRFNPKFFQLIDQRVGDLRDLGIEADIILFHPYGRALGFGAMTDEMDDRYVRYVVARLAAYRNVWWSIANEYDLLRGKQESDWDRMFHIVEKEDPYGHLRSIHQAHRQYNMSQPWVTHVSSQNPEAVAALGRAVIYRQILGKPVVFDEIRYEGNITARWGNLTAEEMVERFWIGTMGGTYITHGETIDNPNQSAWGSQGAILHGQSPPRIAFLKKIIEDGPVEGLNPIDQYFRSDLTGKAGEYYLMYFAGQRPTEWPFELPRGPIADGVKFQVDVIDTWNMTITPIEKPFVAVRKSGYLFGAQGDAKVPLPGKPYIALRIKRIGPAPQFTTRPATTRATQ